MGLTSRLGLSIRADHRNPYLSTSQTITVGGAAANQFINWVADSINKINIQPEGFFCLAAPNAGYAVTASTGDLLKIANSAGASCSFRIALIGSSS
ncbi:MAG: hypothetical protein WCR98_02050 [Saccharofermentanales bacterium]|jgi:hypothetical protein